MSLVVNCPNRQNAFLLTLAIEAAGLSKPSSSSSLSEFLTQIAYSHPRFALLTQESIDEPSVFSTIRQSSPETSIVVCWLNEVIAPNNVWETMNSLDLDMLCTLPELTDCLITLQQGRLYRSSLWSAHPALRTKEIFVGWQDLTIMERRILKQLIEIRTGPQIAEALHISPKTVNNHKANISQKLYVSGGPGSLTRFVVTNRDRLRQLLE